MAVPYVKKYYGRIYFDDEFMPACLRDASFFETQCTGVAKGLCS